jgi:hypothetical protein
MLRWTPFGRITGYLAFNEIGKRPLISSSKVRYSTVIYQTRETTMKNNVKSFKFYYLHLGLCEAGSGIDRQVPQNVLQKKAHIFLFVYSLYIITFCN